MNLKISGHFPRPSFQRIAALPVFFAAMLWAFFSFDSARFVGRM
jgi:hypothetical protein